MRKKPKIPVTPEFYDRFADFLHAVVVDGLRDDDERLVPAKLAIAEEVLRGLLRRDLGLSEERRWKIFKRDGYRCQGCGAESCLTVDHRIPVKLKGTDDDDNLQTLCRSCNSAKGAQV